MWHQNLDHHSRIMPERICVCVYVPLYLIYYIWDHAMCLRAAWRLIKVWSLFSSCFISSLQWIWVNFPWTSFLQECQQEFIWSHWDLCLACTPSFLQVMQFILWFINVCLCLSVFKKNRSIWVFLPVCHILLNTSCCNHLNVTPLKINGHIPIMRTMERGWQVIIMRVRNNVITEAGSLTRLIGKGVSQLITLDPPFQNYLE